MCYVSTCIAKCRNIAIVKVVFSNTPAKTAVFAVFRMATETKVRFWPDFSVPGRAVRRNTFLLYF